MRSVYWPEIEEAVTAIARREKARPVYGVPRGGCVPAAMLGTIWRMPILDQPKEGCLVVDDIFDSGRTREQFKKYDFVTLFTKKSTDWMEFPWEVNETGPEDAVVRLIQIAGGDPTAEGLRDTPKRVIRALRDMTSGNDVDPSAILARDFATDGYDEIVALTGIHFYSLCEHHMLPFFGEAAVAYLPLGRIVGLSKLARLVECFSRRLQVQERLTVQIADAMQRYLAPQGVAVIIKAQHLCMGARGVRKPEALMTTSIMRGVFRDKPEARAEVLRLLQKGGGN